MRIGIITRKQFTAQPQRDKHALNIHISRSDTMQINTGYKQLLLCIIMLKLIYNIRPSGLAVRTTAYISKLG